MWLLFSPHTTHWPLSLLAMHPAWQPALHLLLLCLAKLSVSDDAIDRYSMLISVCCHLAGMDLFSSLGLDFCRIDNGGAYNSSVHRPALWVHLGNIRCPRRCSQRQRPRTCCPQDQCGACQSGHGWIQSAHQRFIHICLIRHPHGPVHCQEGVCHRMYQYLTYYACLTAADVTLVCQAVPGQPATARL